MPIVGKARVYTYKSTASYIEILEILDLVENAFQVQTDRQAYLSAITVKKIRSTLMPG
jgi:hypothetical protein